MFRSIFLSTFSLVLPILLASHPARAGAIATFVVDMKGTRVSGVAQGTVQGIGTATLDSGGVLTILLTTRAVTGWTESIQDSMTVVHGTLVENVLSAATGRTKVTSCTRTGGFFDACSHVVLDRDQRFDDATLARPIAFQLDPGQITVFEAEQTRAMGTVVHYVFHLTALPEPGGAPALKEAASGPPSDCALR